MEVQYRKDMTSVFVLEENQPDLSWFLKQFLNQKEEVLYFVNDEKLRAVVSIGDLFKCLEGRKKEILNTDFTCVHEKDDEKMLAFFGTHPTIHELPLIDDDERFIGIVKSGKCNSDRTWDSFRIYAKSLYYDEKAFYIKTAEKFMKHFKGIVFLANLPDDDLAISCLKSSDEQENFNKRSQIDALTHLRNMTGQEEKIYWGDTVYESGISKRFAEEFSKIEVTEKNGIKYFDSNISSHYITFENGKRKLPNQNSNAKRKIYLAGPCTIFGAYVTDNQTIEYYLQQIINDNGYEWQVVNLGTLGPGYEFQYLLTECIHDEDIVLIAFQSRNWTASFMEQYQNVHYIGNFSDIFVNIHKKEG